MNRPNWYSDHPAACTCATCQRYRTERAKVGKVGRNDKCPCGSGKKFKRCHGS